MSQGVGDRVRLAEAQANVAEFKQRVREQEGRVVELSRGGHPAAEALDVLRQFAVALEIAETQLATIRRELDGRGT